MIYLVKIQVCHPETQFLPAKTPRRTKKGKTKKGKTKTKTKTAFERKSRER